MHFPRTLFFKATLASAGMVAGTLITTLVTTVTAHAETTLYVGMNGGTLEKNYETYVFPGFEKANNVKIVVVPGTSSDIIAKMQAQKAKPTMQLAFLDDGVMVRAVNLGLCQKIPDSPVLKDVIPDAHFENDQALGITLGVVGIGYNKKLFDANHWAAPDSWAAFADPKYKGKVIFPSISSSTYGLYALLMYNRTLGGTDTNLEPAFSKWSTTVGPNVLDYISNSAQVSEMVQNGEAAIFPTTVTAIVNYKDQGLNVGYATPKEGAVKLMYSACMLAGNTQPALAQKLIEYLVGPQAQSALVEQANALPVNKTVKVSDAIQAKRGRTEDLLRNMKSVDWTSINQQRAAWNDRWNRTVER